MENIAHALEYIYKRVSENPKMSEHELYEVILHSNFFFALDYEKFGTDIKGQKNVPGSAKKADYVCYDNYKNVIYVMEVKPPSTKRLISAFGQLWNRYVLPFKSQYGVLIDGWKLIVYKRIRNNPDKVLTINFDNINHEKCATLYNLLKKPTYDLISYSNVEEYFATVEKISLDKEIAKEDFYETFKLDTSSSFGSLLSSFVSLFDLVYPSSRFLKGAYGFWKQTLAIEPKKTPDSWKPFLKTDQDVLKLMFCIESSHALLARIIIAKSCEDLDFPGISISRFLLQKIPQSRGVVPLIGYPIILNMLIREMRDQLVYSIFEDDVFSWWKDALPDYIEKSASELLREDIKKPLEDFSRSIANLILIIYKFDFKDIAGDPLGELYQKYFDHDTRKALGEFYTPVEVVNYMLDAVGYKNIGKKRLIDPACGSGTFIVEALKRYLKEAKPRAKQHGWATILRELCLEPQIVGFDIHPFACMVSRTRFMIEIIPYFKKAIEEEAPTEFYLHRLPVFRTDSLEIEMHPPEYKKQKKIYETMEDDIIYPIIIPMKVNNNRIISLDIKLPSWRKFAYHGILLYNLGEYFCTLQAVFDAVKNRLSVDEDEVKESVLRSCLMDYLTDKDFNLIGSFLKPYADQFLKEIANIQSEFEDGRLVKAIEDRVLASVLKNYFRYDFVVGNPPYVRIELIPEDLRAHYKILYESATGRFDLYMLFIERGIKWLTKGGMFGYIISNMFTKRDSGKALRKFILENSSITQFLDFGNSGVFAEVTNYPAILVLKNEKNLKNEIKVVRFKKQKENIIEEVAENILLDDYSGCYYDIFSMEQTLLTSNQWSFATQNERKIKDKMNAGNVLLEFITDVRRGIVTGKNSVFIIKDKKDFEVDLLKPIVGGQNIKKWEINWEGSSIIYPHISRSISVNIPLFPIIYEYLTSHRLTLEQRYCVKRKNPRKWYELHDAGDPTWFKQPKIVVGGISNKNAFALDISGNFHIQDSSFFIIKKLNSEINLKYLLGILNSTLLEFFFKQTASIKQGNYFEYRSQYLNLLPIKIPNIPLEKNIETQIIQKVNQIILHMEKKKHNKDFPDTFLDEYRSEGFEFDEIKVTFKMAHKSLNCFLSGFPEQGFNVFPDKDETPIWVDTKEKAEYLLLALGKSKVDQNEMIKLLIPRANSIVKEILDKVTKNKEEINFVNVEQLEHEINTLVYKLYEISEDEQIVIESFLFSCS